MTKMDLAELAQYTYQGLKIRGIEVTLSGGACVTLYTRNAYVSGDLNFIGKFGESPVRLAEAMGALGFKKENRHFIHPQSDFYVEFPPPPLAIGEQVMGRVPERMVHSKSGRKGVRMLSPTDCVKDRLCGYNHWGDRQSLDQAVRVAKARKVDFAEIRKWSSNEGMLDKFKDFMSAIKRKAVIKGP
jgi:hypothetical protein